MPRPTASAGYTLQPAATQPVPKLLWADLLTIMADVILQAIRDEELQYCEAYEGRFGGVEVKTDKVKKEETKKKGDVDL